MKLFKTLWLSLLLTGCNSQPQPEPPKNYSKDVEAKIQAQLNAQLNTSAVQSGRKAGRKVKCTQVFLLPRDDEGRVFSGTADFSNGSHKTIEVNCDLDTGKCAVVKQ